MSTLYMFPPTEEPPEDIDVLAGEYALGVLDPGEAAAIRLRAATDPALRDAIWSWQVRLVPMTSMLQDIGPPADVWASLASEVGWQPAPAFQAPPPPVAPPEAEAVVEIAASIPPQAPAFDGPAFFVVPDQGRPESPPAAGLHDTPASRFVTPKPVQPVMTPRPALAQSLFPPATVSRQAGIASLFASYVSPDRPEPSPAAMRLVDRVAFWRATTAAALVAAVVIGGVALLNRPAPSSGMAAIGVVNAPAPIYLAESDTKGFLRVTPMALVAVPNGRDLQLWMIPPGSDTPVSLGVLASRGQTIALREAPTEGTRFIVSLESHGGSKTGAIAGQVLYGGTFADR